MDKPKRWTWDNWMYSYKVEPWDSNNSKEDTEFTEAVAKECLHANDDLLDWQEKRIEELELQMYDKDLQFSKQQTRRLEQISKLKEALRLCMIALEHGNPAKDMAREALKGDQ